METENLRESSSEHEEQVNQNDDRDDVQSNEVTKKPDAETNKRRSEYQATTSRKSPKHSRIKSRSVTPLKEHAEVNRSQIKSHGRSANAFINFIQTYKKNYPDTNQKVFEICGKKWKNMTDEQKQPFIDAANEVKKLKYRKTDENEDHPPKKSVTRVIKRKTESKRKETIQKKPKVNIQEQKTNSETDTATPVQSSLSDADSN